MPGEPFSTLGRPRLGINRGRALRTGPWKVPHWANIRAHRLIKHLLFGVSADFLRGHPPMHVPMLRRADVGSVVRPLHREAREGRPSKRGRQV